MALKKCVTLLGCNISGSHTIYEASFIIEDVFIRVDIMHLSPEGWDIYEVKSSSTLRSYHKEDASLQWYVLDKVIELETK